jgi:hypothetical protein
MTAIDPRPAAPEPGRQAFYHRLYEEVYRHLYPALQVYLARLADLTDLPPM